MAEAKKSTKKVERIVYDTEESVTLELSMDEASILRGVLGQFQSNSATSPIWKALGKAGVRSEYHVVDNMTGEFVHTLRVAPGSKYGGDW